MLLASGLRAKPALWYLMFGLTLLATGCTGNYILTVPDQVAPAYGEAVPVVRLQRSEIAMVALPVQGAAMRMKIEQGPLRGAYTDKLGYAGTTVPAPTKGGKYKLDIAYMDKDGDEAWVSAPLYVYEVNTHLTAVEFEALPVAGPQVAAARHALRQLNLAGGLVYFTDKPIAQHTAMHNQLSSLGYPDGAIFMWQSQKWHVEQDEKYRMPRVVVETRMTSQLSILRQLFPELKTCIASSSTGAGAFMTAGLQCTTIGQPAALGTNVVNRNDWMDLAIHEAPAHSAVTKPATAPASSPAEPRK